MSDNTAEIFFRPEMLAQERINIPAELYNQCRLMLTHCQYDHVFVPIAGLQILAVIDEEEVIFIDTLAYAVHDEKGGRLIKLAWHFRYDQERDDLTAPAPIDLLYYAEDSRDLHMRLIGEFKKSLDIIQQRYLGKGCEERSKKVLPFAR